jgi:thiol-disulfide isomerase/thioredoxin
MRIPPPAHTLAASSGSVPAPFAGTAQRRFVVKAGVATLLPVTWPTLSIAQVAAPKKPAAAPTHKPLSAAEESEVAKLVAKTAAEENGEPPHPAAGELIRVKNKLKLFDGQDFSEAQAKNKLLIIYYWASWCTVCKVVSPRLHAFWLANRSKVEVLALSTDTDVQPAFAYAKRTGFKFPISMASAAGFDDAMAPRSLPTVMLRSRQGVIVSVDEGEVEAEEFKDYLKHW